MAPIPQWVTFDVLLVVAANHDIDTVHDAVKEVIVAFLRALAPGLPLLIADLCAEVTSVDGVVNAKFRNPGDQTQPAPDVYLADCRASLYTTTDRVETAA
jgi:uncharacterized phage protein gp47/JayE